MLPYLGPEIIAVMQAARNSSPNDSRSGTGLLFPDKSNAQFIPLMVLSHQLTCSNGNHVGVLNVRVCWRP